MRLGEKIPVPELAPARAARVRQQVMLAVAGQPATRDRWLGGALRLTFAVAAVAAVAIALALDVPEAIESRGPVVAGGAVVTELATGEDSVSVVLGDATVTLAPETRTSIIRSRSGIEIALERGRIDCEVEPIPGRDPFVVGAAGVEVEVVGTVFAVDRSAAVRVEVERGKVRVRSPSGEFMVEAGSAWTEADGVHSMIAEVIDEPTAGNRDDTTEPAPDIEETSRARARARARARKRSRDDARDRKPRPPRYRPPDRHPELLAAMALETSDPKAAVRAYAKIAAASRGDVASFALYSKAYVEHFALGARSAALETLDHFNRRFPRAREAQSAQWLRVLGLCDLGRAGECRAAAYSYMRRFPDGKFVDAATAVVNR